jgi:phosphate ABC transporter phosphate-binding protein
VAFTLAVSVVFAPPASAASYVPISGAGSTWSQTAIKAWDANVAQYNMTVNYAGGGSTVGRNDFRQGTVDWAGSDIPYGVKDGNNSDPAPARGFVYIPVVAGGTTFMYNLKIGNNRVTNLRLSGATITGIFTGTITKWNDPAVVADNPGLTLPAIPIVPVVRSDGSGATAQFTQWMIATQGNAWTNYCAKVGRNPCTQTSAYPILSGTSMVGQAGDQGVSGYVSQSQAVGSIGYVEYSYALLTGFPVAKVLNSAGYYTEPTPGHVAVSLLAAKVHGVDDSTPASDPSYLTQNLASVYTNSDPRTYPLSSYSYLILPTKDEDGITDAKGFTIGDYAKYVLCQGQNQVDALGYSALPINLVQAAFTQVKKVPGSNIGSLVISSCNNPTFSTDGTNTLAKNDPQPQACDKTVSTQCTTATGGAASTAKGGSSGGTSSGGSGGSSSGGGSGAGGAGGSGSTGGGSGGPGGTGGTSGAGSVTCDPDTGCTSSGGVDAASANGGDGGANQVAAKPVSTPVSLGDSMTVTLMVIAAALLLGLGLAPALITHLGQAGSASEAAKATSRRGQRAAAKQEARYQAWQLAREPAPTPPNPPNPPPGGAL